MSEQKINIECPSWALPREELPFHIKINKDVTDHIKNIKIILPDCIRLIDVINLTNYKTCDNTILINKIEKTEKSYYDYFGIIIATIEPFKELKKEIPLQFEFHFDDGSTEKFSKSARIFRPLLKFKEKPKKIILKNNDANSIKIPISLQFKGFGEISLRSECKISGKIVSVGTSVLDEILVRMLNDEKLNENKTPNNNENISVNEDYVANVAMQLKEKFLSDGDIRKMLTKQELDDKTKMQLYELSNEQKERFMKGFYKTVENYLIQIITDILNRNLSNNLQLYSHAKIRTSIKLPSTKVAIRFFYKDLLDNEYDAIEETVEIIDERENPSTFEVDIPLDITPVDETNAYKNVEKMEIGINT